jgi:hypothetical protein
MEKLAEYYYDPSNPGSFGGVAKLHRAAGNVPKKTVKKWLMSQPTYTLHKPVVRNFGRNKVIAYDKDEVWNADLVFMTAYASENDGYKYILTVIDVLSKYAWAFPLKDKRPENVMKAFENIFKSGRKCKRLHTDKGGEFWGSVTQNFFKTHGIIHYSTENEDLKAMIVERFNRTLKNLMFRYFTYKGTRRYIDVLPKLMESYNNSKHRSIKMRPAEVVTRDHVTKAYKNLYPDAPPTPKAPTNLKVGDLVRMVYQPTIYQRGYFPQWTEEIFTIKEIKKRDPYDVYIVQDYKNENIKGTFYAPELQKVENPEGIYRVSKVLKTRKLRGRPREYLVSWLGYPESANSWVTEFTR